MSHWMENLGWMHNLWQLFLFWGLKCLNYLFIWIIFIFILLKSHIISLLILRLCTQVLRTFDSLISANCTKEIENSGIDLWKNTQVKSVRRSAGGLEVTLTTKDPEKKSGGEEISTIEEVDCLLWAIGREPNTTGLHTSQMVTSLFPLNACTL